MVKFIQVKPLIGIENVPPKFFQVNSCESTITYVIVDSHALNWNNLLIGD